MFFCKKHFYAFQLKASLLGPKLKEKVKQETREQLEGQCLGKLGYIIKILDFKDEEIQLGLIDNDTGGVSVIVWYLAVFFRPFANQVLDAIVVTSNNTEGFVCKVGPLDIFVSRHSMPEDMKFDTAGGDTWVSDDGEVEIRTGSIVRLRLMGLTVEAGTIAALGTIKDDYLGLFEA